MCFFLTIGVNEISLAELNQLASKFGIRFAQVEGSPVQATFGSELYCVHDTICDCGTEVGAILQVPDDSKQINKLRKKGWSQTKIDRLLTDKQTARSRRQARMVAAPYAKDWVEMIHTVLRTTAAQDFFLLNHFYSESPATEQFKLACRSIKDSELDAQALRELQEDTALKVTR